MNALVQKLRNNTLLNIKQNPSSIVVTRKTRTFDEAGSGGYSKTEEILPAFKARIYKRKVLKLTTAEGGVVERFVAKMLCDHCANVKRKTATNLDSFSLDGDNYQIVDVKVYKMDGIAAKKECEVELVE